MELQETFYSAFKALKTNLTRSILTTLGVVIGVLAVILLVAIGQGVNNFITDQFNALGTNLIVVAPGRINFGKDPAISFANNKLTIDDVDLLNQNAKQYIVGASPSIRLNKTVEYKTRSSASNLVGANYIALELINFEIDKGRMFNKVEQDAKARVAVIGPQAKNNLFPNENPIGKTIKISDVNFEIIGLFKSQGSQADQRIIVPYTSLQYYLKVKNLSGITIKARSSDNLEEAQREITTLLLQNHHIDEFGIATQKDILGTFQNILTILSIGLAGIAAISLLVGGIGVMNIMLVSVTERTNEIGLRKALGATPGNIALQFLMESSLISLGGGIIGISLGYALVHVMQSFVRASIPFWSVAISFIFSIGVGILFGTYPAIKASRKNPVEALVFES